MIIFSSMAACLVIYRHHRPKRLYSSNGMLPYSVDLVLTVTKISISTQLTSKVPSLIASSLELAKLS